MRQAATALKFAQSTNDPKLAAALIEKASNLLAQIDESSDLPDVNPLAPDIEPPPANVRQPQDVQQVHRTRQKD